MPRRATGDGRHPKTFTYSDIQARRLNGWCWPKPEWLLLYRGIRPEQSYFISLFLPRLGRRWQMTSQGLVLLFEVGTWPPHDGFRRMGRFNLWSVLADDGRQGLRTLRTHLTRRPREDTFLPEQNSLNLLSALPTVHAA
jgi:hypothetical protein